MKLEEKMARLSMPIDARHAALSVYAPRLGEAASDAEAGVFTGVVGDLWARPFAPAHIRGRRAANGDVQMSWVRRARLGGDAWRAEDPPLGETEERYRVEILAAGALKRQFVVTMPACLYPSADQIADFGAPPSALTVRIAQWSPRYGYGQMRESILWL